ncbi:aspartate kinase [Herbivorax sp. ANBcel31]|uniref:aspartate kinase n=1 Tax=Herbivorax sp. ANBcel31 TaxID=3069754 RepID=UPI0027B10AFB|nr:aspartate kinase [Herbivorax sp. ANBcel31]MDQ2085507.1 aspartate kinase [Herbivorax sp. ANBcel31]
MKVVKFGGTSLASAPQIKKVCDIILSDSKRRLVIVSAPGKRFDDDVKMTDLLIELGEKYYKDKKADKELKRVIDRFDEIAKGLGLDEEIVKIVHDDLNQRLKSEYAGKEKFMDTMKAAGEDNNAKVVAEYLKSTGVDAKYVNPKDAGMLLSDECGNGRILPESYDNLKLLSDRKEIMIFPGFFGCSKNGDIVTFSRGGSDISGSILAAAVNAEMYENFTDVDSVFAANPKIIENPKPIPVFTYKEMRELAYSGFSVLHEETLEPVYRKKIPVCIKNTNNPSSDGTLITPVRESKGRPVIGIASAEGFCSIYVTKYMMNREIGFGRKILAIIEDEGLSYEHTPSGIDDMSIILEQNQIDDKKEQRLKERIKKELEVDDVSVERDLALVMVVGEGMRDTVGVADKATNALSKAGVNIEMINQGSSEVSMMFGVLQSDNEKSVRALYSEFF